MEKTKTNSSVFFPHSFFYFLFLLMLNKQWDHEGETAQQSVCQWGLTPTENQPVDVCLSSQSFSHSLQSCFSAVNNTEVTSWCKDTSWQKAAGCRLLPSNNKDRKWNIKQQLYDKHNNWKELKWVVANIKTERSQSFLTYFVTFVICYLINE